MGSIQKGDSPCFLLDAAQSVGLIPVHPGVLKADIIAFTGHKGLHGPPGTGGLYVSRGCELKQVILGATNVRSNMKFHPPDMPALLEAGTPNIPALAGLAAALRWHEGEDESYICRMRELNHHLYKELSAISGIRVFDGNNHFPRIGICSFQAEGWDVEEVGYVLGESFGIVCRSGLHFSPLIHKAIGSAPEGTTRFSVSGFNTHKDIELAVTAVRTLTQ